MKRGSPLVDPPLPSPMLGQTRTVTLWLPVQVADRVAVVSTVALAVWSTVPKLTVVMEKLQLADLASAAVAAASVAAPGADRGVAGERVERFIRMSRARSRPGCRSVRHTGTTPGTRRPPR